jgi:putative ABC transport system permease protein
MTLTGFIAKNAARNKRRSLLTMLSISFSLLLLTLMMTIWHSFYMDQGSPQSALRVITRHRVSLNFFFPVSYRRRIRDVPGVVHVAPMNWFGGLYKNNRPENFFPQFGTDPKEILKVYTEYQLSPDQLAAWQHDRTGAIADSELAKKFGWKLGDKVVLKGAIFPVDLELTIRGIFTAPRPTETLFFDWTYVEEAVDWVKGQVDTLAVLVDHAEDVSSVSNTIDQMFRSAPEPTRTETEKAFQLSFVAMLGNVKVFILSISGAVVFAILLVSANAMAMSVRERVREIALMKTLGFGRGSILLLFVGEAMALSSLGGLVGVLCASGLVHYVAARAPQGGAWLSTMIITVPTQLVALAVAAAVGFASAFLPAYHASRLNIVEGLRHIG